jgi:aryl-alcohol dehydrogenase-like predicted oxidoreductase
VTVERFRLAPDHEISRIIKGGWQLSGDHGPVDREAAIVAMGEFVDAGVTTFDCADIYTGAEEMIGAFLARRRDGTVKVHTKFVPDLDRLATIDRAYVESVIDRSRARLGVDRLDLVQFHWWDYDIPGYVRTTRWLQELQAEGKIRHLAMTNFDVPRLSEILDAGVRILSMQTQYSLLDHRPAGPMTALAEAHGFRFLCYGVLAGGFLTDAWLGRPDPGFAFDNRSLVKYRLIIEEFGGWDLFQELLAACRAIADRHARACPAADISTVAIRHVLDQPVVAAAIVGARSASRLAPTLAAFDLVLDDEDQARIEAVRARATGPAGDCYTLERDRSGRHGRIMKYNLNRECQP